MIDEIRRTTPIRDSVRHIPPYPEYFFMYRIPGSRFYQATARLNGIRHNEIPQGQITRNCGQRIL